MPQVRLGWVLITVKAFELNRSELYTRLGHLPSVSFPLARISSALRLRKSGKQAARLANP
jgi:hypothetical protein